MTTRLEQVKSLLRGIRQDEEDYRQLRAQFDEQRLCMIRRDSDALLAVNDAIHQRYQRLSDSARARRETLLNLGVSADRDGIAQVFSWLPAAQKHAAQQSWQQLERQAASCQSCNEKNGELLTMQYEFVQTFLGTGPDFIYRG